MTTVMRLAAIVLLLPPLLATDARAELSFAEWRRAEAMLDRAIEAEDGPGVRVALFAVCRDESPRAVRALIRALPRTLDLPVYRAAVAAASGMLDEPAAAEAMAEELRWGEAYPARYLFADVLLPRPGAIDDLLPALLDDRDPRIALHAVEHARALGTPAAVRALIDRLTSLDLDPTNPRLSAALHDALTALLEVPAPNAAGYRALLEARLEAGPWGPSERPRDLQLAPVTVPAGMPLPEGWLLRVTDRRLLRALEADDVLVLEGPRGFAAPLLERLDVPFTRLPPDEPGWLDPDALLIVNAPVRDLFGWSEALSTFVSRGGYLVASSAEEDLVSRVLERRFQQIDEAAPWEEAPLRLAPGREAHPLLEGVLSLHPWRERHVHWLQPQGVARGIVPFGLPMPLVTVEHDGERGALVLYVLQGTGAVLYFDPPLVPQPEPAAQAAMERLVLNFLFEKLRYRVNGTR